MLKWMNVKQIVSKICFIAFTKSKGIQWFGDDAYSNVGTGAVYQIQADSVIIKANSNNSFGKCS